MDAERQTIFALATPPGRSGVAVVRVSGPSVRRVLERMTQGPVPPVRQAAVRALADPETGERLDKALVLRFEAPESFTGEDVLELHLHGGRAVVDGVVSALSGIEGCRAAEAGAFTRRAFDNGKLDLTEVEGLADLIDAQTAAQRRQALRQHRGEFGALIDGWRNRLVRTLAHAEADIDFPDEDLPDGVQTELAVEIGALTREIETRLADGRRGERLREGYRVAIVGAPNAGKSSLFNRLVQRSAAIVSDRPGTTRDVLEASIDIGGYPVTLSDTAGLREARDAIESEGVRRAEAEADSADLVLLVRDASLPEETAMPAERWRAPVIEVLNKGDLAAPSDGGLSVSALTGQGLDALSVRLVQEIAERLAPPENAAITRARHREALEGAAAALGRAAARAPAPELVAEDLRLAVRALGRVTGKTDVEDLLDVIFRDFCIGK